MTVRPEPTADTALLRTRALGGIGQDDGTLITAKDCAVILDLLDRLAAVTEQRDRAREAWRQAIEAWRQAIHDAYMKGRAAGPPDPNKPEVPDDMDELERRRAVLGAGETRNAPPERGVGSGASPGRGIPTVTELRAQIQEAHDLLFHWSGNPDDNEPSVAQSILRAALGGES